MRASESASLVGRAYRGQSFKCDLGKLQRGSDDILLKMQRQLTRSVPCSFLLLLLEGLGKRPPSLRVEKAIRVPFSKPEQIKKQSETRGNEHSEISETSGFSESKSGRECFGLLRFIHPYFSDGGVCVGH